MHWQRFADARDGDAGVDVEGDIEVIDGDEEDQVRLHQGHFHIAQAALFQTIGTTNAWKILSLFAQKAHASFSSLPDCHETVEGFVKWMVEDLQKMEERIQQNPPQKQQQQEEEREEQEQEEHEDDDEQQEEADDQKVDQQDDDLVGGGNDGAVGHLVDGGDFGGNNANDHGNDASHAFHVVQGDQVVHAPQQHAPAAQVPAPAAAAASSSTRLKNQQRPRARRTKKASSRAARARAGAADPSLPSHRRPKDRKADHSCTKMTEPSSASPAVPQKTAPEAAAAADDAVVAPSHSFVDAEPSPPVPVPKQSNPVHPRPQPEATFDAVIQYACKMREQCRPLSLPPLPPNVAQPPAPVQPWSNAMSGGQSAAAAAGGAAAGSPAAAAAGTHSGAAMATVACTAAKSAWLQAPASFSGIPQAIRAQQFSVDRQHEIKMKAQLLVQQQQSAAGTGTTGIEPPHAPATTWPVPNAPHAALGCSMQARPCAQPFPVCSVRCTAGTAAKNIHKIDRATDRSTEHGKSHQKSCATRPPQARQ